MILSMTGYGRSEKKGRNFLISVEIKSINNRFYDPISKIHPFFVISVGISISSMVSVGMIFPFTFVIILFSSDRITIWNIEFNG